MSKEDFMRHCLPVTTEKLNSLMSRSGLNGYRLITTRSGNWDNDHELDEMGIPEYYIKHGTTEIIPVNGSGSNELIANLNKLKRSAAGKKKSRRNKKSRKNRKTSRR